MAGLRVVPPTSKNYVSFASLLGAMLGLTLAMPLGIAAGVLLSSGQYLFGGLGLLLALGLAFSSTIGLLLGLDLWSLLQRLKCPAG